jgi:hypothetical protein
MHYVHQVFWIQLPLLCSLYHLLRMANFYLPHGHASPHRHVSLLHISSPHSRCPYFSFSQERTLDELFSCRRIFKPSHGPRSSDALQPSGRRIRSQPSLQPKGPIPLQLRLNSMRTTSQTGLCDRRTTSLRYSIRSCWTFACPFQGSLVALWLLRKGKGVLSHGHWSGICGFA